MLCPSRLLAPVVAVLFALALPACGGSSGSSGAAPARVLAGDWHVVLVRAGGGSFTAGWGTGTTDAAGALEVTVDANTDGAVTMDEVDTAATTIAADGTLSMLTTGGTGLEGGISRAGDIAVVGGLPGGDPRIAIYLKKEGAFDNTILNGPYHLVQLRRALAPPATTRVFRSPSITFDGMGGRTDDGLTTLNENGTTGTATFGTAFYGVAADGTLSTQGDAGGVLSGGDAFIAGGRGVAGNDPRISVYLAADTGADDTRLQGTYAMIGMQYDVGTAAWRTTIARLTADGAGGGSVSGWQNVEGAPVVLTPTSVTWSVGLDGSLTLDLPGGDTVEGAVSPDGRLGLLGGGTQDGTDPAFFVLVRVD